MVKIDGFIGSIAIFVLVNDVLFYLAIIHFMLGSYFCRILTIIRLLFRFLLR